MKEEKQTSTDDTSVKENANMEDQVVEENLDSTEGVEVEENPITALEEQLSDMEDKFLRAQAEIANMRNRNQKERETASKYRSQDLAKELLPALDNLERALSIEVQDEQGESLKKGIEMVHESILAGFKHTGVEPIQAIGEIFDPNLHQAVQTVPVEDGQKVDEIVNELQKGYKLHDRVLRASMVIVAQ